VVRFVLGGAATVFTGPRQQPLRASIGGLFLALPAIFCASATLIESHEIRRKREAGLVGERRRLRPPHSMPPVQRWGPPECWRSRPCLVGCRA
jgi:hypothetical protein